MLWILCCLGIAAIGAFLYGIIAPLIKKDWSEVAGIVCLFIAGGMAIFMLLAFIFSRADLNYKIEEKYKEYIIYSTLYELDAFADDPVKEMLLYQEILDYNEKIATVQRKMNSDWTNIFYPKKYWGDLPVIEIKRIE